MNSLYVIDANWRAYLLNNHGEIFLMNLVEKQEYYFLRIVEYEVLIAKKSYNWTVFILEVNIQKNTKTIMLVSQWLLLLFASMLSK